MRPEDDTPMDGHTATAAPTAAARRGLWPALRGLGWLAVWLPGAALAVLLAGGVAGWIWAGRDGSLPQALDWAQAWLDDPDSSAGQLQASGAQGSLRQGGQVQQLRWTQPGLDVQLQGLRLAWTSDQLLDALLGRGVQLQTLHLDRIQVNDQREPQPSEPLTALPLPFPVALPWSVDQLQLQGRQNLQLTDARGHYRYGPVDATGRQAWGADHAAVHDAHHLRIDAIRFAQGQYRLAAVLGAQAPMPLHVTASGQVPTQVPGGHSVNLQASADARGNLAGLDATLDLSAQVAGSTGQGTPTLAAHARVHPWAPQPLDSVDARAHQLDLAALWPQAPVTALSGQVQAAPDGDRWRATVDLTNSRSGPWNQQRLPLDRLQARAEQQDTTWQVAALDARLGDARVQGSGQYTQAGDTRPAQWQGQLQALALNPAQLWSGLTPARLDLQASAQQAPQPADAIDLQLRVQGARGATGPGGLRELRLQGQWRAVAQVLQLDEALLDAAPARLSLRGAIDLPASSFNGSSTLALPGAQARFNGLLAAHDSRGELDLRVDAADPLLAWVRGLQKLPVVGAQVQAALAGAPVLRDGRIEGQASLQLQWRGGLGPLGYPAAAGAAPAAQPLQARLTLDVPRLSASLPGQTATWQLRDAQLQASGSPAELAVQLRADASQGPWSVALQTQGRAQGFWPWPGATGDAARLSLDSLNLRASDASRRDRVLDWQLRNSQPLQLSARSAADGLALQVAGAQLQLQPALRPAGATPLLPLTLAWDSLAWQGGTLQTRGRLLGLPMAWIDPLARAEGATSGPLAQAGLSGDVLLDGDWDLLLPLSGTTPLSLNAHVQRRSGDLTLLNDSGEPGNPPATAAGATRQLPAGLREARLSLSTQGRAVQARLRWDSERLGQVSAEFDSTLAAAPAAEGSLLDRWWPASAPLNGRLSARLPQVGVWSALAPPGWRMRGTLQAEATLGGTRAAPDWSGRLQADQLALRSVVDGFEFSQGLLRASLAGERILIERFELKSPLGGALNASGQAQWQTTDGRRQPLIDLQVKAQQLRVSNRADRRLSLSGEVNAQLSGPRLRIRGQLKADSALFLLPDETTPSLDADVVVRGGRNLPQGTSTVAQVQPDVSVDIDLGPQFEVRGRGLQARLSGQLNLRATPALPALRVFGEVRVAQGSYRAYGQNLVIDNGALVFNGPYDDPALNILAIRPLGRDSDQQVGVQISGSAQGPRVRLVATPDMPDAEKLAWLVLGRPATGAGAEAAILQQAALALLAGNDSALNGGLAGALGLDELSYRGEATNADGSTSGAVVTLGKRLSNQLYLSYETGLAGAMGTVSVFYDISRRFTLRARAGEENAVDLIFTLSYD
jgi:translocation and assembly module TamB